MMGGACGERAVGWRAGCYKQEVKEMPRRIQGFTLVELMIVVVILALLGVLAVNIYKRYVLKAKTSEAMTMLAHIKAKQEAYHAEHYRYAHIPAFHPAAILRDEKVAFTPLPAEWQQLGLQTSTKMVHFQYSTISDQGGAAPPAGIFNPVPAAWFVATAQAKFDDSGSADTTYEIASDRDTVWKKDKFGSSGPP
jgi:prepilin-type N-terminal cleavage/methylation domain-containing protein